MRREAMEGPTIDLEILRAYLGDALPPEDMARVEKALRDSAELRARLEEVRENRGDQGLHTLGAIWRRGRLSCPTRQQLGSYLLDALDPDLASYLKFHLDVIACPYCQANVADLRSKGAQAPAIQSRHNRIVQSSQHLLGGEEETHRGDRA
jgi:uncharacterized protein YbaR (Trm112 family)